VLKRDQLAVGSCGSPQEALLYDLSTGDIIELIGHDSTYDIFPSYAH